ncbi:MAG: DMT family transporter [Gammaproteobacteria bacterium]
MSGVRVRAIHWVVLLSLVALWGSSYLMIEIALTVWRPAEIAGLRILTAAAVLMMAMLARSERLPTDRAHWMPLGVIALVGNCVPFFLISWGQQQVESGLAGVLAASTPLFVLVMAHFALEDERVGRRQVLAFVVGFAGVVVLLGPDSLAALGGSAARLLSQLAILGGAACYGAATVIARKLPAAPAVVTSAGVMLAASVFMLPFVGSGLAVPASVTWQGAAAIGFLGLLGTGVASILYFRLIAETGARFTSLVNYLVPVCAVGVGAAFLGEKLPLSSWLGLFLLLCGLILISKSVMIPSQINK